MVWWKLVKAPEQGRPGFESQLFQLGAGGLRIQ